MSFTKYMDDEVIIKINEIWKSAGIREVYRRLSLYYGEGFKLSKTALEKRLKGTEKGSGLNCNAGLLFAVAICFGVSIDNMIYGNKDEKTRIESKTKYDDKNPVQDKRTDKKLKSLARKNIGNRLQSLLNNNFESNEELSNAVASSFLLTSYSLNGSYFLDKTSDFFNISSIAHQTKYDSIYTLQMLKILKNKKFGVHKNVQNPSFYNAPISWRDIGPPEKEKTQFIIDPFDKQPQCYLFLLRDAKNMMYGIESSRSEYSNMVPIVRKTTFPVTGAESKDIHYVKDIVDNSKKNAIREEHQIMMDVDYIRDLVKSLESTDYFGNERLYISLLANVFFFRALERGSVDIPKDSRDVLRKINNQLRNISKSFLIWAHKNDRRDDITTILESCLEISYNCLRSDKDEDLNSLADMILSRYKNIKFNNRSLSI